MQVGITGGIGSGKSLVCRIFRILGIPVYDADLRARELMLESSHLKQSIIQAFGTESYTAEGLLDRQFLAKLVFNDPENLKKINSLVHPEVGLDYNNWVDHRRDTNPYVIKEAALLFESGSYRELDRVYTVTAPEELRIKRVIARDPHRDREQVLAIIERQLPESELVAGSEGVIINDEQRPLIQQVLDLHQSLIE